MEKIENLTDVNSGQAYTLDFIVNRIIVPIELAIGFGCQALSVNYMISIIMLTLSILRKNGVFDLSSFIVALYSIHLEQYLANLFLFSGNLLIIAMACDGLKAITYPLQRLNLNERGSHMVVVSIYVTVAILLLPVTVMHKMDVRIVNATRIYIAVQVDTLFIGLIRYVVVTTFEVILILLILIIYTAVLIKYNAIVKRHFCFVRSLKQSSSRLLTTYYHKATVICLASVTAFLVCNLPSALMEMCYLSFYLRGEIECFLRSWSRVILRSVGNSMLAFNFTLTFVLQYAVSIQYRKNLQCILEKGKRNISQRLMLLHSYRKAQQFEFQFYGNRNTRNYV
ncbi:unnamed protein product [Soboliphyme baturini]|uniref:G_PROTEIN_RECEP_F1_2 domain-containing protein n=1 Tax=Soboliphyme baturini TaxID=241478 RepID=A0A183IPL6_9BILA|nr:unnamed protein product [Soboliphyme baturini]